MTDKHLINKLIKYGGLVIISIVSIAIIASPFWLWFVPTYSNMEVWIIDKTVPDNTYREHKSIMWLLNFNKILDRGGETFKYDKNYYGFYPGKNKDDYISHPLPVAMDEKVKRPDLIYIADTYGVYKDDFIKQNNTQNKSDQIYGGITQEETKILQNNLKDGNTIIGEFNTMSSTSNSLVKKDFEKIFGVQSNNWVGRYYENLSKGVEVPSWLIDLYETQHSKKWDFHYGGYVLNSSEDNLVVLEEGKHLGKNKLQVVMKDKYLSEFKVSSQTSYNYWIEFIKPIPGIETIADFKLDITEEGKSELDKIGLSNTFPAMVRFKNSQFCSYYFAGDFADRANDSVYRIKFYDKIMKLASSGSKDDNESFFWKFYVPVMNKILADVKAGNKAIEAKTVEENLVIKAQNKDFKILKNGRWENFFAKGVNIGCAQPGKYFTNFPEDEETYYRWLNMIGEMNSNVVRLYTLLPPAFYNALYAYNTEHKDKQLMLFQEIWPEENPEDLDYLKESYNKEYKKEIVAVIDAIHGKARIPQRKGRSYGVYLRDVSPFIAGFLIGRELEPDEVIATNTKNIGYSFSGKYLYSGPLASPSESWLASCMDYSLEYEENTYKKQSPTALVSWPTLDPIEHDSEWNISKDKAREYNDKVAIDINNILTRSQLKAGIFGAYHIYPNYPDFMNNEESYSSYSDEEGQFNYGGYLKEFMAKQSKYPALVAEFGLATGMGNAHANPNGYNHGNISESDQGKGLIRMLKAMKKEGYSGGLVFEWMDEWAKKTWTTEAYMIPYDRHVLWHNAIDPEQNYGILANESSKPLQYDVTIKGASISKDINLSKDETFLYMDMNFNLAPQDLISGVYIGLDTFDRALGDFKYDKDIEAKAPSGMEFLLQIKDFKDATLKVVPGYNVSNNRYQPDSSNTGVFEDIIYQINKERIIKSGKTIAAQTFNLSLLPSGEYAKNSKSFWYLEDKSLHIRLPWGALNFSDPSSATVLSDKGQAYVSAHDTIKTTHSEGIVVSAILTDKNNKVLESINNSGNFVNYKFNGWEVPNWTERLKPSYYSLKDFFRNFN